VASRFVHIRLVGPAIVGMTLLIVGLAAVPYYGVRRVDAETRQRQEALVTRNMHIWVSDVEFSLTAWTIWDESIAKIDNAFDREWTDRNIGASLIGTSRTRSVVVLNRDDAVIYAKTDDSVKNLPFFVRGADFIRQDAAKLVADVRARELRPARTGIPLPVTASHIEAIGDEAVLLTASLFQPDFGTAKPKGIRAPILITAMPIGGTLQEFFGERFLLDDPQITPRSAVAADRAWTEIAVDPLGEERVLSWRPPTPASDLLMQSLPLVAVVFIVLVVGGFYLVRITQRTAGDLVREERLMRHAAAHDVLTGLANRSRIEIEFAAMAASGEVTVVCLDLDGFKGVNDRHGHAAGDELLETVAAKLRAGTRQDDRIFRLGGDEFAIFMPRTSVDEAETICWRLSKAISAIVQLSACEVSIGASFGISGLAAHTCDMALSAADEALYIAKSLGRGKVMVAGRASPALAEPRASA
jgi:diguanylate cyclase (GGDEF)-like protein